MCRSLGSVQATPRPLEYSGRGAQSLDWSDTAVRSAIHWVDGLQSLVHQIGYACASQPVSAYRAPLPEDLFHCFPLADFSSSTPKPVPCESQQSLDQQ